MLTSIHHIAIICSDYEKSKAFYTETLGFEVIQETYRQERGSYKLDLALGGSYVIELFSFPNPPERPTRPEAAGLRHLAFTVKNLEDAVRELKDKGVETEPVRTDPLTGRRFTFFFDPDRLPLELYEA
ncbi:VOC family protein [Bacillus sp. ISL-51]|uniref:SMU1112c/YaeR family gloxylase I-like metalloprotein n=1 Tax=Bacteria TaxID=2 RepID=UPI001BE8C3AC|nr:MULTISPECIES: VOC family protein [Bacteria]MBT2573031.1 VOC family protein [Bacillus sp. ISL-51]MBT2635245.1 VOC family protein [Bacillus sp. ISL-26]MBT2713505.1 VOC family protein [Pseudomonas sp. ISL-88]